MLSRVRNQLIAGFGVMLTLLLILGGFSLGKVSQLGSATNNLYNHPMKVYTALLKAQIGVIKIHRDMKDVVLSTQASQRKLVINKVSQTEREVFEQLSLAKQKIIGEDGISGVTQIETLMLQWKPIRDEVIMLTMNGQRQKAAEITRGKGVVLIKKLLNKVDKLILYANTKANDFYTDANLNWSVATRTILTLSVVATIFACIIASLLIKNISQKLTKLSSSIRLVEENSDLSHPVPLESACEIGDTARSFNQMLNKFSSLVKQVLGSTDELSDATMQVADATNKNRIDSEKQQEETEMVATAMNEMAVTIAEVSRNAEAAASAAETADSESQTGKNIVFKASEAIAELNSQIGVVSELITQLKEDSGSIGSVMGVIKGIAEQTNLLALNAAIEAARAGEQGRGFAVVADEVRTLASRTQESTHEIEEMVERLQQGTNQAFEAIEIGKKLANESASHALKAGDSLNEITSAVSVINEMNAQIATAADEQRKVTDEMNKNITNINQLALNTATDAALTAKTTQSLYQLASRLKEEVTVFKVS